MGYYENTIVGPKAKMVGPATLQKVLKYDSAQNAQDARYEISQEDVLSVCRSDW